MTSQLNPYMHFRTEAREAMTFYHQILGGDLVMNTFGEFGATGDDGVDPNGIMHAQLDTALGYTLMASDAPPGMEANLQAGNVTICLNGDDDELRGYFERLMEGGDVAVPIARQMWGDEFGTGTDKFGINWIVNISPKA